MGEQGGPVVRHRREGKRDGERVYGKFSCRDLDSRSCHSAADIKEEKTISKIAQLVSHVQ
jgi:hypothetical protein